MDDKENVLNTFSSDTGDLDVVQAKYEVKGTGDRPFSAAFLSHVPTSQSNVAEMFQNFLTELASGRGRLSDIIHMAEDLVRSRHSKEREIKARQRKISKRYGQTKFLCFLFQLFL